MEYLPYQPGEFAGFLKKIDQPNRLRRPNMSFAAPRRHVPEGPNEVRIPESFLRGKCWERNKTTKKPGVFCGVQMVRNWILYEFFDSNFFIWCVRLDSKISRIFFTKITVLKLMTNPFNKANGTSLVDVYLWMVGQKSNRFLENGDESHMNPRVRK